MDNIYQNSYLKKLTDDTRHFIRKPGLVLATSVAVILIFVFIALPIGSVLIKSFTVTYPIVTVHNQNGVSYTVAESERRVTRPIQKAMEALDGVIEISAITEDNRSVIVLRFRKDWDDLRGLRDVKRAFNKIKSAPDLAAENIRFELGQETVSSLDTYAEFFSTRYYYKALFNSIFLAIVTTCLIVPIAFCFAYLGLKGPDFIKGPLRVLGLLPLIAPPFIFALALILIGGRSGMLTKFLHLPFNLYGWPGVITAQFITFLPLGYLMIENVLKSLGSNLDDAASDMGASDVDVLLKITIPLAVPGILKAALLVFILSIADFGNPMLIGGEVSFLATDAYLLWIGENNLEMSAVFCVFLVIPSIIIFINTSASGKSSGKFFDFE
jgi:ABC-type Fe3+ transport system permease subunit